MDNNEALKQIRFHLYDVAFLAAQLKRKPASDADWAVMKAMNLITESQLIFISLKEQEACGHSSQESSSAD